MKIQKKFTSLVIGVLVLVASVAASVVAMSFPAPAYRGTATVDAFTHNPNPALSGLTYADLGHAHRIVDVSNGAHSIHFHPGRVYFIWSRGGDGGEGWWGGFGGGGNEGAMWIDWRQQTAARQVLVFAGQRGGLNDSHSHGFGSPGLSHVGNFRPAFDGEWGEHHQNVTWDQHGGGGGGASGALIRNVANTDWNNLLVAPGGGGGGGSSTTFFNQSGGRSPHSHGGGGSGENGVASGGAGAGGAGIFGVRWGPGGVAGAGAISINGGSAPHTGRGGAPARSGTTRAGGGGGGGGGVFRGPGGGGGSVHRGTGAFAITTASSGGGGAAGGGHPISGSGGAIFHNPTYSATRHTALMNGHPYDINSHWGLGGRVPPFRNGHTRVYEFHPSATVITHINGNSATGVTISSTGLIPSPTDHVVTTSTITRGAGTREFIINSGNVHGVDQQVNTVSFFRGDWAAGFNTPPSVTQPTTWQDFDNGRMWYQLWWRDHTRREAILRVERVTGDFVVHAITTNRWNVARQLNWPIARAGPPPAGMWTNDSVQVDNGYTNAVGDPMHNGVPITPIGHTFGGWFTEPNGQGTRVFGDTRDAPIRNIGNPNGTQFQTLHAHWIVDTVAITSGMTEFSDIPYDPAAIPGDIIVPTSALFGSTQVATANPPNYGFRFVRWHIEDDEDFAAFHPDDNPYERTTRFIVGANTRLTAEFERVTSNIKTEIHEITRSTVPERQIGGDVTTTAEVIGIPVNNRHIIIVKPRPGYEFVNFTGNFESLNSDSARSGTDNGDGTFSLAVRVREHNIVVTANFRLKALGISAASNNLQMGNFTTDGHGPIFMDQERTFTAVRALGFVFLHWEVIGATYVQPLLSGDNNEIITIQMGSENLILMAIFFEQRNNFILSTTEGGMLSIMEEGDIVADQDVTLVAFPFGGFRFVRMTIFHTSGYIDEETDQSLFKLYDIDGGGMYRVHAYFERVPVNITLNQLEGGTIEVRPLGTTTATINEIILFVVTPDIGWEFIGVWNITGAHEVNRTNNSISLIVGTNDIEVSAFFRAIPRVIRVSVPGGGGHAGRNQEEGFYGDMHTLRAVANPGWVFSHFMVDGVRDDNAEITVTIGNGDMNVVVHFRLIDYEILFTITGQGSASSNYLTRTMGQTVTLTAVPAAGWEFYRFTINGIFLPEFRNTTLTVTVFTEHLNVVAEFRIIDYTIQSSVSDDGYGGDMPNGTTTGLNIGDTRAFTAKAHDGYRLRNFTVTGAASYKVEANEDSDGKIISHTITIVVGTSDITVVANFELYGLLILRTLVEHITTTQVWLENMHTEESFTSLMSAHSTAVNALTQQQPQASIVTMALTNLTNMLGALEMRAIIIENHAPPVNEIIITIPGLQTERLFTILLGDNNGFVIEFFHGNEIVVRMLFEEWADIVVGGDTTAIKYGENFDTDMPGMNHDNRTMIIRPVSQGVMELILPSAGTSKTVRITRENDILAYQIMGIIELPPGGPGDTVTYPEGNGGGGGSNWYDDLLIYLLITVGAVVVVASVGAGVYMLRLKKRAKY